VTFSIDRIDLPNQSILLVLRGVLDYASAPELRAAISAAAARQPTPRSIVVDLNGVELIDHIGVGTLVVGNRICSQVGIELEVRKPSALVQGMLGMGDPVGSHHRFDVAAARTGR
jgi:anti-anti-sigma factor